jgi:hypothetical protein
MLNCYVHAGPCQDLRSAVRATRRQIAPIIVTTCSPIRMMTKFNIAVANACEFYVQSHASITQSCLDSQLLVKLPLVAAPLIPNYVLS